MLGLEGLLEMELAWVDDQGTERLYWFPSLYYPMEDGREEETNTS